ncbi:hypothetical protein Pfo_026624 [Paulownia fortunei]|nr:hypothetical protein Pfo_026624 [Paulownia fortunei]
MGKQAEKAKTTGGVAVNDLHHSQASLGVRTRAKTMALKKSSSSISTPTIIVDITTHKGGDGCYLQLRSRRLERPAVPLGKKAKKNKCSPKGKNIDLQKGKVGTNLEKKPTDKEENASQKTEGKNGVEEKPEKKMEREEKNKKDGYDEKEEGAFGDKELDFDNKERESTPRTMATNGEITNVNTSKKMQNVTPTMPSAQELEEFFAAAEKQQIEKFIKE